MTDKHLTFEIFLRRLLATMISREDIQAAAVGFMPINWRADCWMRDINPRTRAESEPDLATDFVNEKRVTKEKMAPISGGVPLRIESAGANELYDGENFRDILIRYLNDSREYPGEVAEVGSYELSDNNGATAIVKVKPYTLSSAEGEIAKLYFMMISDQNGEDMFDLALDKMTELLPQVISAMY